MTGCCAARRPVWIAVMAGWLQEGRLVADEHIDEGLENSFDAFMRLFAGSNQGKMILKIA